MGGLPRPRPPRRQARRSGPRRRGRCRVDRGAARARGGSPSDRHRPRPPTGRGTRSRRGNLPGPADRSIGRCRRGRRGVRRDRRRDPRPLGRAGTRRRHLVARHPLNSKDSGAIFFVSNRRPGADCPAGRDGHDRRAPCGHSPKPPAFAPDRAPRQDDHPGHGDGGGIMRNTVCLAAATRFSPSDATAAACRRSRADRSSSWPAQPDTAPGFIATGVKLEADPRRERRPGGRGSY